MIRLASVLPNSIASDLPLDPGSWLLSINGKPLRDALDLQFHEAEDRLELEVRTAGGDLIVFEIQKDAGESLGAIPEPDKVRRCTNACAFCFVKGNPQTNKLRAPLYIKDDDYRLSFMFGHYVTLTNLREEDWERISEQRLTPLYVSVHATDGDTRLKMLRNPRSANINEHLDRLAAAGIQAHAQVVLCSGLNDGPILEQTIDSLYQRGDSIPSLSIVPVGLTAFNEGRGIRTLTREESREAIDLIDRVRTRAQAERGRGWCFAADELFLQAGLGVPGESYFDDPDIVGNGVGAMSQLAGRIRSDIGQVPSLSGQRIVLLTGTSMAPMLGDLASELEVATGAETIQVEPVRNTMYGPMVTTAGLLPGSDYRDAMKAYEQFDQAIFSRTALNDKQVFLDDMSLSELQSNYPSVQICPSEHVTDVLIPA
ncbi:MAG: DUF512 domain-containing protein [Gemmatimonadota bacterium]